MEWKFRIVDSPESDEIKVFILRRDGAKTEYITIGKDGFFEIDSVPEGAVIKPFFRINGFFWQGDFLESFANAIRETGVAPESEAKLSATLEATKYHLEDMRKLVFK